VCGLVSIICPSRIKSCFVGGEATQERARLKFRMSLLDKTLEFAHKLGRSKGVGISERSTTERGETGAHDHGEIHVGGIGAAMRFEAAGRFVEHEEDHAGLQKAPLRQFRLALTFTLSPTREDSIRLFFPLRVEIETGAGFSAMEFGLDHSLQT